MDCRAEVLQLPDDGRQQVVGEHFYQTALQRICRGKTVPRADEAGCWENSLPTTARLVAEHDNSHDRAAVRVIPVRLRGQSWLLCKPTQVSAVLVSWPACRTR